MRMRILVADDETALDGTEEPVHKIEMLTIDRTLIKRNGQEPRGDRVPRRQKPSQRRLSDCPRFLAELRRIALRARAWD